MSPFLKEACIETLQQAVMAQEKGANRIELCSHLEEGGLTPSNELITKVVKKVNIPVRVMIRPRAGNFIFSEEEIVQMKASIDLCKNTGVEGVVFGVLKGDHTLDLRVISELIAIANPLKIVIHKAIDDTANPLHAVRELVKLGGVDTVLTSGGFATAAEGKETLKEMLEICWGHIELMPAGSITDKNLSEIHEFLRARAYHGRKIVGRLY